MERVWQARFDSPKVSTRPSFLAVVLIIIDLIVSLWQKQLSLSEYMAIFFFFFFFLENINVSTMIN